MASITQGMDASISASYCIFSNSTGSGSGVAIHRLNDAAGNPSDKILIATAAHVVDRALPFIVMDRDQIKYTQTKVLVHDQALDLAILRVSGVPLSHPVVAPTQQQRVALPLATPIYVVGWPMAYDMHSVVTGCVRSGFWAGRGSITQMLFDAPIFGGNSGGGIFRSSNDQLVGLVSWGIADHETFNAAIPGWHVFEGLRMVLSMIPNSQAPEPSLPLLYHDNNTYLLGCSTFQMIPEWMIWDQPTQHPVLSRYGVLGVWITALLAGTPAASAFQYFDVIWALSPGYEDPADTGKWIHLTQDVGIDSALHRIAQLTRARSFKRAMSRSANYVRGGGSPSAPVMRDADPWLPDRLPVHIVFSRTGTKVASTVTLNLEKRSAYVKRVGDELSEFNNEYLSLPVRDRILSLNPPMGSADASTDAERQPASARAKYVYV